MALPCSPGTYVIALAVHGQQRLEIGRRGLLVAPEGVLLYVGSALGPGGLRARLGRHLRGGSVKRWHIDYVRRSCPPVAAWYYAGKRRKEHAWAQVLLQLPGAEVPLAKVGASDCDCSSHLIWLRRL
ncbi:unnamed protein product, partial [Laminaria digitata]